MNSTIISIPIEKIMPNPDQPRRFTSPESIREMADSLKAIGQQTPIKVRQLKPNENSKPIRRTSPYAKASGDRSFAQGEKTQVRSDGATYMLIGGHRRVEGAKLAGMKNLDCIVLDIPPEETALAALMDNNADEMGWLDWDLAIYNLSKVYKDMPQRKLAQKLGISQPKVNNALKVTGALNPASRGLLDQRLIKPEPYQVTESIMLVLAGLEIPNTVEKALWVVLDRQMAEPQVRQFVTWIKAGNKPEKYPLSGEKSGNKTTNRRFDPNDPNRELWEPLPYWFTFKISKKGMCEANVELGRFQAPVAVYAAASWAIRHQNLVQPDLKLADPFKEKLEELLEKGVQAEKEQLDREQKEWETKQVKKAAKGKTPMPRPQAEARELGVPISKSEIGKAKATKETTSPEPRVESKSAPTGPPTEEEMKPLMDLLGNKDVKDNLKKMFKGLF